jgi:hypothetical protein
MRLTFWRNTQPPHIYNEQTKLLATFLNNIAVASFTLGVALAERIAHPFSLAANLFVTPFMSSTLCIERSRHRSRG